MHDPFGFEKAHNAGMALVVAAGVGLGQIFAGLMGIVLATAGGKRLFLVGLIWGAFYLTGATVAAALTVASRGAPAGLSGLYHGTFFLGFFLIPAAIGTARYVSTFRAAIACRNRRRVRALLFPQFVYIPGLLIVALSGGTTPLWILAALPFATALMVAAVVGLSIQFYRWAARIVPDRTQAA